MLKYFRNSQINPVYTIVRNLKMQFREVPSMAFANFIAWLKNAFLKELPTLLSWETGSLSYNWFVSQSCIGKFQSAMIRSVTVTLQPVYGTATPISSGGHRVNFECLCAHFYLIVVWHALPCFSTKCHQKRIHQSSQRNSIKVLLCLCRHMKKCFYP